VDQAPANLRAFSPIISSAHRVTGSLGELIEKVLPLGNSLRAYIPDVVGTFQNLGSSIGTYDANGHIVTISAGFQNSPYASSAARELRAGDCGPGHLKLPFIRLPGALECQPWTDSDSSYIGSGD
jgi:hypothetical protein